MVAPVHQLAVLQAAIAERAEGLPEPRFAVLDFDNTCIVNDVAEATLAHLCRHRLLKCPDLIPAALRNNGDYHEQVFRRYYALLSRDIRSASLLCARMLVGFRREEAEAVVRAAIDSEGDVPGKAELYGLPIARGLAARPALQTLAAFAAASNVQVWIVSASPEIAVRTAMQRFGLPGRLIALRNGIDGDLLTKAIEEPWSIAEGKVDCIRKYIDPAARPLFGVGDSMHDLPMLEYARIGAVVDVNERLTHAARRRGWFVLPSG